MKPILFNTDMVRAIMDGHKTVTRRVVKPQPKDVHRVLCGPLHKKANNVCFDCGWRDDDPRTGYIETVKLPYSPGDTLYVRETFFEYRGNFYYKADRKYETLSKLGIRFKWHPSIHMPSEAARIFLWVTDVRVERLRPISDTACMAEGITCAWNVDLPDAFAEVWNSTIKPADRALYGWEANPWVWVIEFEKIRKERK